MAIRHRFGLYSFQFVEYTRWKGGNKGQSITYVHEQICVCAKLMWEKNTYSNGQCYGCCTSISDMIVCNIQICWMWLHVWLCGQLSVRDYGPSAPNQFQPLSVHGTYGASDFDTAQLCACHKWCILSRCGDAIPANSMNIGYSPASMSDPQSRRRLIDSSSMDYSSNRMNHWIVHTNWLP